MKRIACLYNANSGSIADKHLVTKIFAGLDIAVDFLAIKIGERAIAKRLQEKPYFCVVAAGGDGTVRLAAELAVQTNHTLGILPLGTLNHFAKDLGLPLELESAAKVIASGTTTLVDYCSVNGLVFVNNASLGIYPATVINREKVQRFWGKWLGGLKALVSALHSNPKLVCTIAIPDGNWDYSSPLIFIGNNRYHVDKFGLGGRSKLNTGKMFMYVVRAMPRRKLLFSGLLIMLGFHRHNANTMTLTSGPMTIESAQSTATIALDGEVFTMDFPLKFEMHAGQLKVIVQR